MTDLYKAVQAAEKAYREAEKAALVARRALEDLRWQVYEAERGAQSRITQEKLP